MFRGPQEAKVCFPCERAVRGSASEAESMDADDGMIPRSAPGNSSLSAEST